MDWVRFNSQIRPYLIAIPNEGKRNIIVAANLKRMGMISGVPDYFLMIPNKSNHGFWIEFKAGKNKLTKNQEAFFTAAKHQGYEATVVYSAKGAIDAIKEYLKNQ